MAPDPILYSVGSSLNPLRIPEGSWCSPGSVSVQLTCTLALSVHGQYPLSSLLWPRPHRPATAILSQHPTTSLDRSLLRQIFTEAFKIRKRWFHLSTEWGMIGSWLLVTTFLQSSLTILFTLTFALVVFSSRVPLWPLLQLLGPLRALGPIPKFQLIF